MSTVPDDAGRISFAADDARPVTAIPFLALFPVTDRMDVIPQPWILPEGDPGPVSVSSCPWWPRPYYGRLYLDSEADVVPAIPVSPPSPLGCFPVAHPRGGCRACSPSLVSPILAATSPPISVGPCPVQGRRLPPSPLPRAGSRPHCGGGMVGRIRSPRFRPRRSSSSMTLYCRRVILRPQ